MNKEIIDFVNEHYGCSVSVEYYIRIDLWKRWWKGYVESFHRYTFSNGERKFQRELYSLKMAKKVCEDWASILMNEKTDIIISDEKASEFVQGTNENGGVFETNDFWVQSNRLVEKAFATGTGAVTIRVENARVSEDGVLKSAEDAEIKLSYVDAEQIIPLSYHGTNITEAAFCSKHIRRGQEFILLEVHTLEGGEYVIHNHWFSTKNGVKPEPNPEGLPETFSTGADVPWFSIFMPNIENSIDNNNGLGVSVLHGCLDILKGIDIAYNNFNKDFELGGKKVFMLRTLVEELSDGTKVAPDDVGQQLFIMVDPDNINPDKTTGKFIYEFNPQLRVAENKEGVQANLDYLSFKCGLGNKHYQFNAGSVITATQYTGEKQDLVQNAHKHYITVRSFLVSLVRSIIHIGRTFCGLGGAADCDGTVPNSGGCRCNADINIVFDKSVVIDEASERETDRQDVRDKIMSPWEYRVKWYGETEEEAKAALESSEGLYGEDDFE